MNSEIRRPPAWKEAATSEPQKERSKFAARVRAFAVALTVLLCAGCPARWKVVFVNGADRPLRIAISNAEAGSSSSFVLAPRSSHKELFSKSHRLTVFDAAGGLLFQIENPDFGLGRGHAEYPSLYILVTSTNIYPIPHEYRTSWRDHLPSIVGTEGTSK